MEFVVQVVLRHFVSQNSGSCCWQGDFVFHCCPEARKEGWGMALLTALVQHKYASVLFQLPNTEFSNGKAEFWIFLVLCLSLPSVCSHAWLGRDFSTCTINWVIRSMYFVRSCWYQIVGCFSGFCHLFKKPVWVTYQGSANLLQRPFYHLQHFRTAKYTLLSAF